MQDPRKDAPSFHRNIEPILGALVTIFSPEINRVLEIGSGTGQHVARFGAAFPEITFQPTEYDAENLSSIDAWSEGQTNILSVLQLDVMAASWFGEDVQPFDALFCANVIHITPWEVTEALLNGASKHLRSGGQIILYGPFKEDGKHTSDSNAQFELWLKERDPRNAIHDITEVKRVAASHSFNHVEAREMPANNFLQIFMRD